MILLHLGAEIRGFALPPERPEDHFVVAGLAKRYEHVDGDIRDGERFFSVARDFQPEFVFHLAAQPLVRLSYEQPKETFDTNVAGSVNVLEAVRRLESVRSLIFVTSDKCYRNNEWCWGYRENDVLGGHDPYSASKAAAEIVFSAYLTSFFQSVEHLGAASVRAGNVIGGGDWARDRIVPDTIRSLQAQEPVFLRNPQATRPWQHVLDPLFGYITLSKMLWERPAFFSGAWNFGPESDSMKTVAELSEAMVEFWGGGEIERAAAPTGPHEAKWLHLNCDKAKNQLDWKGRWAFRRAVQETVSWYREVFDGREAYQKSMEQIIAFGEESHDNGR